MKKKRKTTDTEGTNGYVKGTDKSESNSNELVERLEIENTPFTAIRIQDKWFLTMGKYKLTPPLNTKDEALAAGVDESWWRIMSVIQIMIDENEIKKLEQITQ